MHENQAFVRTEYKLTAANWLVGEKFKSRSHQNTSHQSILHEAVLYGNIDIVQSIIDLEIININLPDINGNTPLHLAAFNPDPLIASTLIRAGASIHQTNNEGNTPLHMSAKTIHGESVAKILIASKAKKEARNKKNKTPFDIACEHNHFDYHPNNIDGMSGGSMMLWATTNDSNIISLNQETFIQMVKNDYRGSITKLGRTRVKDLINKTFEGLTPLQWAIRNGHPEMITLLIALGAKADYHDLVMVIDQGNALTAKPLQQLIKDIDHLKIEKKDLHYTDLSLLSYDSDSLSALVLAVIKNNPEIVQILMENHVDPNWRVTKSHPTPIELAVTQGNIEIIVILLNHKATPCKTSQGKTLFQWAIDKGHAPVVSALLKHGADPNQLCSNQTPLHRAIDQGHAAVVSVLLKQKPHLDTPDMRGWSPLHLAAHHGLVETVAELLKHHANPTLVTNNGETAYDLAKAKNHEEVMRLLSATNSQSLEITEAAHESYAADPLPPHDEVQPLTTEAEVHPQTVSSGITQDVTASIYMPAASQPAITTVQEETETSHDTDIDSPVPPADIQEPVSHTEHCGIEMQSSANDDQEPQTEEELEQWKKESTL